MLLLLLKPILREIRSEALRKGLRRNKKILSTPSRIRRSSQDALRSSNQSQATSKSKELEEQDKQIHPHKDEEVQAF